MAIEHFHKGQLGGHRTMVRDHILSPAWVAEVTRLLPHARLITIPGAAHAINLNSPCALAEAVRPFLNSAWARDADQRLAHNGQRQVS